MEDELGPPALAYTKWAAEMAVDLDTRVPWTMGKQVDAPDPVVSIESHHDPNIQSATYLMPILVLESCRSIPAMVSTATGSIRTSLINRRCGVKPGQGGEFGTELAL